MSRQRAVIAATTTSRIEADLIAGLLRAHGIACVVSADDAAGWEPQLQFTNGVAVLVSPEDQVPARGLLENSAYSET